MNIKEVEMTSPSKKKKREKQVPDILRNKVF